MNDYKVYYLLNTVNHKTYFGLTKRTLAKRFAQHRRLAREGSKFLISRAIFKYGWEAFETGLIADGLTKDQACQLEIDLIAGNKSCYESGYNMELGGQTGISTRPETTERRRQAGIYNWLYNPVRRAAIYDPERLRKISEASKANWRRPEYRAVQLSRVKYIRTDATEDKKRRTYLANGYGRKVKCVETGEVFPTLADASRWVNGNPKYAGSNCKSNILACVKGLKRTAYGFTWVDAA